MDFLLLAFADAFQLWNLVFIVLGVVTGITIGAIPGLNAAMAIAIAVPLTLTMEPLAAIGMLVGVMKGGGFGGAIAATLLNTPGEPSAAATALDAHPLAKEKGKPRKALKMALFSSVAGDTCSDIVLILLAAPLAIIASQMGKVEQTSIILFSFTMVAGLAGKSLSRGIIATLLGILVAQVGMIEGALAERFTFGIDELSDGLPLAAVAIGVLALPEVLQQIIRGRGKNIDKPVIEETGSKQERGLSLGEFWRAKRTIARGAAIGTSIGALPGLGSSVAAFLSYGLAKRFSKTPDEFGKGALEGIGATESANSAVNGANMIPLLALGIPGSVSAALLVGAFIIHGVEPGPGVFEDDSRLIYGLFVSMMVANVSVLLVGQLGLQVFSRILRASGQIIYPLVALLCFTGVYISSGAGLVGIWIMLVFAVLGYVLRRFDYSLVCFVIGVVLGDAFEENLRGAIAVVYRDPVNKLLEHPFALVMFAITLVFVVLVIVRRFRLLAQTQVIAKDA